MGGRSHTQPYSHSVQIPVFFRPIPYPFLVHHSDTYFLGLNCGISDFRSRIKKKGRYFIRRISSATSCRICYSTKRAHSVAHPHTRVIRDSLLLRSYPSLVAINNPPQDRVFPHDVYVKWTPQSFCSVVTLDFNSVDTLTLWKTVTGLQKIPH